jgi:ribosomal protein S18 acetylase RimI-like enzyme
MVRPIRPAEADRLAELTVAAYRTLPGAPLSDGYAAELADVAGRMADTEVLVAVGDDGRVLGGVTYLAGPSAYSPMLRPGEAGIRMLAVAPEARRRGVGAALVQACIQRAVDDRLGRVCLQTTASMATAQRVYRRAGFRRAPQRDEWFPPDLLLLAFVLDLTAVASRRRPGGEIGDTRGA